MPQMSEGGFVGRMSVLTPQTVESKSGPSKKPGGRPWTVYKWTFASGERGSTFDKATNDFLTAHIGQQVNVDLAQTEKGTDIVSAYPLDGNAPPPRPARVQVQNTSRDDFMRPRNPAEGRIIARQACLHAATRLLSGSGSSAGQTIDVADKFFEWVFREEVGVRHMAAGHTQADVTAEAKAIANDKPADTLLKEMVVGMIPTANADAKAVLKSYGLVTIKDVNAKLTERVAKLFLEANGSQRFDPDQVEIPL